MILQNITKAIREQNYYAVALEFVIVIAGVVIGFQINAWNETRQEAARVERHLTRLDQDFDVIIERLNGGLNDIEQGVDAIEFIASLHAGGPAAAESAYDTTIFDAFETMASARVPSGTPAALREMIASGDLQLISNDALRLKLYEYEEYSQVARTAFSTLRDELLTTMPAALSYVRFEAALDGRDGRRRSRVVSFDRERFFSEPHAMDDFNPILKAQTNLYEIFAIQLALAEEVEALLSEAPAP